MSIFKELKNKLTFEELKNNSSFKYFYYNRITKSWRHWFYNPRTDELFIFDDQNFKEYSNENLKDSYFYFKINKKSIVWYGLDVYMDQYADCFKEKLKFIGCSFSNFKKNYNYKNYQNNNIKCNFKFNIEDESDLAIFCFYFYDKIIKDVRNN